MIRHSTLGRCQCRHGWIMGRTDRKSPVVAARRDEVPMDRPSEPVVLFELADEPPRPHRIGCLG